jgi:hypothetical protein
MEASDYAFHFFLDKKVEQKIKASENRRKMLMEG